METIFVALIGAGGLVASTLLQSRRGKRVERAIGDTNGSTLIQHLEELKDWTKRHEGRHSLLENRWPIDDGK